MIEPLEQRIAPASVVTTATTATWTDYDGDRVTMKWTVGPAPTFATTDNGVPNGLLVNRITFTPANDGAAVTITVRAAGGGDGRIDLGRVDAAGVALASWSSPRASVFEMDAGNTTASFKSFTVAGLGIRSVSGVGEDGNSLIDGALGTVTVNGDIAATKLSLNTPFGTRVAKVDVKGSLRGDVPTSPAGGTSGVLDIFAETVGSVSIGGSIIGGPNGSGLLQNFFNIGTLAIKGSIVGGAGGGTVTLGNVKTVTIGGSVLGGTASGTGKLSGSQIDNLTIGGNLQGGLTSDTGVIGLLSAKVITIRGSIIGTAGLAGGSNALTATLSLNESAGTVTIGGDLIGGSNATGVAGYNGALLFGGSVGSLTIRGDIRGTTSLPATILAQGKLPVGTGNFNAIGRLNVGGSVSLAYIAAGHSQNLTSLGARIGATEINPIDTSDGADAGIGSVTVGGHWFQSNLTAGISDTGSSGIDLTDTRGTGDGARQAILGPIVIRGDVLGTGTFTTGSGFAAEKIARLTVAGQTLFTTGQATKTLDPAGRIFVREV